MSLALHTGTILDGRYRLEAVLGQGGFGITYAAVNIRIDLKTAVKELFWKDHCKRGDDNRIELLRESDAEAFRMQKEHFLREARMLRDFASEPGVVHVLDYFEANGTAYIVMEYIEGRSLENVVRTEGAMQAEDLFRQFLPVVKSLDMLHQSGIIHRDISPDNLIVQENSTIRLIDFGAARTYAGSESSGVTQIAKDCYSPVEMLDKNGKLGPWTDIYSLCATMYYCLTTTPPESAVQRLFVDDLKSPSALGISIDPRYESVLMKGLSMDAGKRYHSMQAFAEAIREVLPEPVEKKSSKKGWIAGITAALVVIAVLAVLLFSAKTGKNKFKGIETQRFLLYAPDNMTAAEFSDAQKELESRLDEFSGEDNYIMTVDGSHIEVTLPYEAFAGEKVPGVIVDRFLYIIDNKNFSYACEHKGNWEDPAGSLYAGENQVGFGDFTDATAVLYYSPMQEGLSKGQFSNLTIDIKTRLDAMNIPYAFGFSRETPNDFLVQVPIRYMSSFIINSLAEKQFCISGSYDYQALYDPVFSISENPNGSYGLCLQENIDEYYNPVTEFIEERKAAGEETLYFGVHTLYGGKDVMLADAPISEVKTEDGATIITFNHLRIQENESFNEDTRFILDYILTADAETELPCSCSFEQAYFFDAEGSMFLDEAIYAENLRMHTIAKTTEAQQLADTISSQEGIRGWTAGSQIYLDLNLPLGETYTEDIAIWVPRLLKRYDLLSWRDSVVIIFSSAGPINVRLIIYNAEDEGPDAVPKFGKYARLYMSCTDGSLDPYKDDLQTWFDSLPEDDPFNTN